MRLLPLLLLASLSLLATAAPLSAQDAPEQGAEQVQSDAAASARLDFAAEGADCPDAGTFADEVSARIGRVGFDDSSERVALVRIARTGSEALVTAEFGGNTRVFRDADCRVAAEAAAAAIAVWLDEPQALVGVLGAMMGDSIDSAQAEVLGVGGIGMRGTEPSDGRVTLRVTTNLTTREPDEDFSFHIETNTGRGTGGSAHYFERLCLMPCETRVAPGVHQFGVGLGTFPAFPLPFLPTRLGSTWNGLNFETGVGKLTRIDEDSELHIEVTEPNGVFRAGTAFTTIGFLGILVSAPIWIVGARRDRVGLRRGGMVASLAAGALFVGGTLMVRFGERGGVDVSVRPL